MTSLATVVASFATAPGTGAASPPGTTLTGLPGETVAAGVAAAASQAVEITLITGDKVRYEPGPDGRAQVTVVEAVSIDFRGEQPPDGGLYLLPDVAEPYVASGVLDRELFNIEYLATQGYDDAQMDRLPLIVDYADVDADAAGPAATSRATGETRGLATGDAAELAGSRTDVVLESIGAAGVSVDKARADRFWQSLAPATEETSAPGAFAAPSAIGARGGASTSGELSGAVEKVWLDRKVHITLDESAGLIGAPEAWDAGLDGTGVTVAVLDTGIDATHPDLVGKVVASESFVSDTVTDSHGHGTHVASTIVGSGAASDGQYRGVAPGAHLVVGKVCDDGGACPNSAVIAAMEWAAQEQAADVVSMSLGCGPPDCISDGSDPLSQAVNNLTASTGALFVIAAGNRGPNPQTVGTPGMADAALTVAASHESDVFSPIAAFSSRGPRIGGALKPDIAAPGVSITAARAAGTDMCGTGCGIAGDGPVGDHYYAVSGTSMATPHVAGAAAILAQQHPDWTAQRLKTTLMSTSLGLTRLFGTFDASTYAQGAGRVDVARAVSQRLWSDTANISPGILELDDPAYVATVTYHNDSTSELTVSVGAALRLEGSIPQLAGPISLDQDTLTVPAGGSATLTVTIDGSAATAFGDYEGVVTAATEAGDRLRTPIGVTISPPLSDLTIRLVKPAPVNELQDFFRGFGWSALRVDDLEHSWFDGTITWRDTDDPDILEATVAVPDGVYTVTGDPSWVRIPGRQLQNTATVIEPEVTVDGDTAITIDLRTLVPVTVSTDRPSEKAWWVHAHGRTTEAGLSLSTWGLNGMPEAYQGWRYPTDPVTRGELWVRDGFILAEPDLLLDLRSRGQRLTLHPAYPDHPADLEDRYLKFTRDTSTVLATEADIDAGRDVEGALVLFNLPHASTDPASWEQCPTRNERSMMCAVVNRAQKAAAAGAAGVLLTTPKATLASLTFLDTENYRPQLPVPVAWLDAPQADQLADLLQTGRRVDVSIDATVDASYEYKLWLREDGQVPADAAYQIDSRDLKRVDAGYHGAASAEAGMDNAGETMHAFWPGELLSFAAVRYFDAPMRRTEYYLPTGPEVVHNLGHYRIDYASGIGRSGNDWRTLVGTRSETIDWGTVVTPGQVRLDGITRDDAVFASCAVCRQRDDLWVSPGPTMGDGSQSWSGYESSQRLFDADGTEIPAAGTGAFPLPPESGRYRLEHVQTDQTSDNLYGRQVRTVWEFTATARPETNQVEFPYGKPDFFDPAPAAWQPVIFLNYDIPLELDNTARAGRPVMFTVYAAAGQPGSGADIQGLELEASFDDGATWTDARVIRALGDGAYWVMIKHPKLSQTTGAVTLRAHAWDSTGNQVTQTVERAYGLTGNPGPQR